MLMAKNLTFCVRKGEYYSFAEEATVCPICSGRLKYRDRRRRRLICGDGKYRVFHLRRYRCMTCGTYHTELPDMMIPYRQYSKDIIERAIHEKMEDCPAEESTINRWKKAYSKEE